MVAAPKVTDLQASVISEQFLGRRGRLRAYVFELATAVVFGLAGLAFLLNPADVALHSVVTREVYPFEYMWSIAYIAAAILMIWGTMAPRLQIRAAGLILLGTALSMQSIAALLINPELRDAGTAVYAAACFFRAALIVKLFFRYRRAAATCDVSGY